jgi:uncharacterized RDD family membrane protein YckC
VSRAAPAARSGPDEAPVPSVRRRLACLLYESMLLFGVVMIAGLLFSIAVQQRHALQGRGAGMAFLFVVLGAYFVWCWSRGGQTLAMQTWHVRLVTAEGRPVGLRRAIARYVCGWVWVLPPLGLAAANGPQALGVGGAVALVAAWVLGYAASALAHPQRQFWHDALCGTQLITWRNVTPAQPR